MKGYPKKRRGPLKNTLDRSVFIETEQQPYEVGPGVEFDPGVEWTFRDPKDADALESGDEK